MAGVTFVAGYQLSKGFERFGTAQRAVDQIGAATERATALELRVARYVGSEKAADHDGAVSALLGLRQAVAVSGMRDLPSLRDAASTADSLPHIFDTLSDAIIARHSAGASLADAAAALSGTLASIAELASRTPELSILADIGQTNSNAQRAGLFATRYLASVSPSDLDAARSGLSHTLEELDALASKVTAMSRLHRQTMSANDMAHRFTAALNDLDSATQDRAAAASRLAKLVMATRASMDYARQTFGEQADKAEGKLTRGLHRAAILVAACATAAVLLGFAAIAVISRTCVRPLNGLVQSVRALAADDLTTPVAHTGRSDEIGDVADALETLRLSALASKDAERRNAGAASASAVERQRIVHASADATERALGDVARSVGQTLEQLLSAADEISNIAGQTSTRATAVLSGNVQGHTRAEKVAAEAIKLVSLISAVEARVTDSVAVTAQAASDAQATDEGVRALANAAEGVSAASHLIARVAQRTRLLALNAAIEAARSGDAGRGFTVVAIEVKALAAQTATATEHIAQQVQAMRQAVDGASIRMSSIRDAIYLVYQLTKDVTDTFRLQHALMHGFVTEASDSAAAAEGVMLAMQSVLSYIAKAVQSAEDLRKVAAQVAEQGTKLDSNLSRVVCELRAA